MMKYTPDFSSRFRILKGGKISLVVSALLAGTTISFAAPSGGVVTSGNANISQSGNTTTINQSTNKASINWQSFSIAPNEIVNFNQPSSSSVTLNRVVGTTNSLIQGAMNANGQVILVNPNGVVFTEGSTVNVGGLIATTKNITDANFQNGNYIFEGDSEASILNRGTINAKYVAIMGKVVANEGTIVATLGRVELAGGDKFTLNLNGDSLLSLRIDEGTLNALVENKGLIKADGGVVYLTTKAVDSILDGMVNNTGIIEAQTLNTNDKGEIVLFAHGGTANVAGEIKAEGGFVETSGAKVKIADEFRVNADKWLIDPNDFTIAASGGDISGATLSLNLATTDIVIQTATMGTTGGNGDIHVNDNVSWDSGSTLTLTAERNININAVLDARDTGEGDSGKVVLEYGQGALAAGNTATYTFAQTNGVFSGKIILDAGQFFSTKLGSDGTQIDYTVITALGSAGDVTNNPTNSLQAIAYSGNLAGNFALGADIDASATDSWNSNAGFTPIGNDTDAFTGRFVGLGNTINGLTIDTPLADGVGLFGYTKAATISNIALTNVNIQGHYYTGALVGSAGWDNTNGSRIENAHVTSGTVNGNLSVGGLIGSLDDLSILKNSSSSIAVTGVSRVDPDEEIDTESPSYIGGLVGYLYNSTIEDSSASGAVTATDDPTDELGFIGGLVGYASGSTIRGANATGAVTGGTTGDKVGGLVGYTSSVIIENSSASGSVTGRNGVGGLVGDLNYADSISDSHATGAVNGVGQVGGLVGYMGGEASITDSYSESMVVGSATDVGGLVGLSEGDESNKNTITGSYHQTGTVQGDFFVGGLVGSSSNTDITSNSFATSSVTGNSYVGGLVGAAKNSGITDAYAEEGSVTGHTVVGGLVGGASGTTITDSTARGAVTGFHQVGGLVGLMTDASTVDNGNATGMVWLTTDNWMNTDTDNDPWGFGGGLVGLVDDSASVVKDSRASGSVRLDDSVTNPELDVTVDSAIGVGGLVGANKGQILRSNYSKGVVLGFDDVGGLVGINYSTGVIEDSYATSSVTSTATASPHFGDVGGLVGVNRGNVTRSYATGNVTGNGQYAGGFVGSNLGTITQSYAEGDVSAFSLVGGFAGVNSQLAGGGSIGDVYARGNVTANIEEGIAGGLVGGHTGNISTSYSTGTVTAATKGGLIGINTDGSVTGTTFDSFWDVTTSAIGTADSTDDSVGGTGKTTAQMIELATYPQGDGGEIMGWEIVTDSSLSNVYPQLRWATDGLGNGTSVWVIAQGTPPSNGGSGEQAQQEQIQTQINDIVTTIVNQTTTSSTTNPTVAPMTPVAVAPLSTTQPTNREMINLAMPGSSYDLVASPSGQDPVSNMEFTDLQRVAMANGLSEIRVPLGNNSIVELVNGGMNTGPVDQLFFVVDGKRNDDGVNNKTKKDKKD